MFGIILFWIHYIVAFILLYTLLRCSYRYIKTNKDWKTEYQKSDERVKFQLWMIILFILVTFVPVVNLLTLISYMAIRNAQDTCNRIYYKSFLTKEY